VTVGGRSQHDSYSRRGGTFDAIDFELSAGTRQVKRFTGLIPQKARPFGAALQVSSVEGTFPVRIGYQRTGCCRSDRKGSVSSGRWQRLAYAGRILCQGRMPGAAREGSYNPVA
jgi:hypothetical protein